MTLDEFVNKAFDDHATDAAAVFDRLPQGAGLVTEAKQLPSLAHLIEHVSGEHLRRWSDGVALLELLERLPVFDAATPQGKSVLRSKAILYRCAGDRAAEARFLAASRAGGDVPEASDRIRMLSLTAQAFLGQMRFDEARRDFDECLALAAYGPTKSDPAARALAAMGHNIAVAFETRETLTGAERAMMLDAALTTLRYWSVAGGWMEIERSEYRLAMSHIKAGDAAGALRHAENCRRIVAENGADAGEMFFAHEAIARSRRAGGDVSGARRESETMGALLSKVTDESFRAFCADELVKLDASLAQA